MRSLAIVLLAIVGALAFQGCGSDSQTSSFKQDAGAAGACDPGFCPGAPPGIGCCVAGACGADFGMGCVQTTPDAGK